MLTKTVKGWFERAPTSVAEDPPTPLAPTNTNTTSQSLLTAARDGGRRSSVPATNNQVPRGIEELLGLIPAGQRSRDERSNNRTSYTVTPSDVAALQAVAGGLRPPGSITVHIVREERITITHRRIDSAGHHVPHPCPRCGSFHGPSTAEPNSTVSSFRSLSKKAFFFYLFFLFCQFMLFFFGSRVSSKA
jgi:hypothetical protein